MVLGGIAMCIHTLYELFAKCCICWMQKQLAFVKVDYNYVNSRGEISHQPEAQSH